jgi:hypothetical protein
MTKSYPTDAETLFKGRVLNGMYYNIELKWVVFFLNNGICIKLMGCAIMYDSGLIGKEISFISISGSLGPAFDMRKMGLNADDYHFLLLNRDIKDQANKHEIQVSYKTAQISHDQEQTWEDIALILDKA